MSTDERRERGFIGPKRRFELLKRDDFRCVYCGAGSPTPLELDHVIPVVDGGTDDDWNLVTSCQTCNRGKGARSLAGAEPPAGLPQPTKAIHLWSDDRGLYLPREILSLIPKRVTAAQRGELVDHLIQREPDGRPFRFGGVVVLIERGTPPREAWADASKGVL